MGFPSWKYNATTAGIVYLHLTLWGSLITFTLAIYTFALGASDEVLVPCAILMILAVSILMSLVIVPTNWIQCTAALAYVVFHQHNARKQRLLSRSDSRNSAVKRPVCIAARLSIALAMLWLISSGWNMIIAARQPVCLDRGPMLRLWQVKSTCKVQRAGTAFSIINLLTTCALFIHIVTTRDLFEVHLLGKVKDQPIMVTPYRFSAAFRISGEKPPSLAHKKSASSDSTFREKPLPKTPTMESRPRTPTVDLVGLGIWTTMKTPVSLPMIDQAPPLSPSRPVLAHGSPGSASVYNRTSSIYQHGQRNSSITTLPGFTPMKEIRRPAPACDGDSAWRALHLPASQFCHISGASPNLRPNSEHGLATIKTISISPLLDLSASHSPSIRSGSAYPYARRHSRNKSAPYAPIPPPSQPTEQSPRSSSTSSHRKRGHIRCTSDPNEMISAHLAAEMSLAMRLDQTLHEVSQKLEAQKSQNTNGSSQVTTASSASENWKNGTETDLSERTASSGVLRKGRSNVDLTSSLYARMEWDMLMGKEVNLV
jgi:hypothetical protein